MSVWDGNDHVITIEFQPERLMGWISDIIISPVRDQVISFAVPHDIFIHVNEDTHCWLENDIDAYQLLSSILRAAYVRGDCDNHHNE